MNQTGLNAYFFIEKALLVNLCQTRQFTHNVLNLMHNSNWIQIKCSKSY